MTTVQDICNYINSFAPFATAAEWDNAGLLIGEGTATVSGIVTALDATVDIITEAETLGCNLIVTHHPIIFDAIKSVLAGSAVYEAARRGISIISAHTNLDLAGECGVNTELAKALGLQGVAKLCSDEFGLLGSLEQSLTPEQLADRLTDTLGLAPRYNPTGGAITRVGICGGSGAELATIAVSEGVAIDAFITADVKHHEFIEAARLGITLYDAGHYATEQVVIPALTRRLAHQFPTLRISEGKSYSGALK